MDISSFLTPKSEVVWVCAEGTVAEALEQMRPNGFGSVPILDEDGRYFGTLSTSDLIGYLVGAGVLWQDAARATPLTGIRRARDDAALDVGAGLPKLLAQLARQSFVSVVGEGGAFIGIVRRRPIIEYYSNVDGRGSRSGKQAPPCVAR